MKKFILKSIAFFALTLFAYSCGGGGEEIVATKLDVSTRKISTNVLGASETITLTAPGKWYAATTGDKWISISPSSGEAGEQEVKITVKTNNTKGTRSATITFTSGTEKTNMNVEQGWNYFFKVPCSDYTVGYGGGEIIIDGLAKSGVSVEMSAAAKSWIKVASNILTVSENFGQTPRNAMLKIIDSKNSKEYDVLLIQESSTGAGNILSLSELIIDGFVCPTDSFTTETDFFYSVDMDATTTTKTAKVTFRGEGVEWITIGDSDKKIYSGDMVTFNNMEANTTLKITSHNSKTDKKGNNKLIISGLPLVQINTQETIKDEPKVDCTFSLFDPKGRTDAEEKNLTYFESLAGIEYRGAGAQRYKKKPYNFKLRDSQHNKREAELLNIRNDNSWILDGMYLDIAHMRNRVCFDLWNQFNKPYYVDEKPKASSGTHGEYVEVFINGEYMGLFILSDRIDRKQYQIDQHDGHTKGGYIYKAKGWTSACLLKSCSTPSNDDYYWDSAEIEQEYPGEDDGKPNFNYMAEVINFVGSSSKEEFSNRFEEIFDTNSVVDAFIFLNMIVADDNIGRNTFWIIRNVETAPKVMHGLWDLDGSLGRNWDRHEETPEQAYSSHLKGWVIGHGNNGSGTRFKFHERIIQENPANIHQKIYDRWNEIKNGALAPSNFNQIVERYAELQKASGARDREVARWKAIDQSEQSKWKYEAVYYGNLDSETTYMKNWYSRRHAVLDGLINSFDHK
ncbi:MAG: CotH kinase family protein [Alistipes sp.]|nr:CotH kinase family protein [Alistipes sp.]